MTNAVQTFTNKDFGSIRVIKKDGEPWWVAKDVCEILELGNTTEALRGLDEDERSSELMNTPGGMQSMSIINEPGLYSLILRSRKSVGLLDEDGRNTVPVMDSLGRAQNTNITNELGIVIENNRPVVSSRDIALVFEKEHFHVIRDIENLELPAEIRQSNFGLSSYINSQNKEQPMYLITRDGFTLLAMGFNGARAMKFKLKYIAAFNAMEEQLKNPFNTPAGRLRKCLRKNTSM